MELVPLSKTEVEGRDAIDAAFEVDESVPIEGNAERATLTVVVRNPHAEPARIDLNVDGDEIVENHTVPGAEESLGVIDLASGERALAVRWLTPQAFSFVDVGCTLSNEEHTLLIDAWDPLYPPRILLDGIWLNRPPGLRYVATSDIDGIEMPAAELLVFHPDLGNPDSAVLQKLHDRTELTDADAVLGVDLDVWIDGKRPCPPDPMPLHHFGPVMHRGELSPGRHHVRVADRRRHRLLLDTEIVANGVDWMGIEISDTSGDDPRVTVRKGIDTLLQANIAEVGFVEGLTPQNDLFRKFTVDGHDLPAGLESYLDWLKEKRKTAKRVRGNYKKFLELRRSAARKTAAGEKPTEEEKEAVGVKDPKGVHDWVVARKKAEGLELKVAGSTSVDGTVTVPKKKGKKTPFDEFSEYSTEFVHEASHVRQLERAARKAGVDMDRLKKCAALEKRYIEIKELEKAGKKMSDREKFDILLELVRCRMWKADDPAYKRYMQAISDPEFIARLEVDEYAGDLEWLDKVIRLLASQSFGIMMGPTLIALDSGDEQEVIVHQNPDGPPRVRVTDGADKVEAPVVERIGDGSAEGWGRYRIKIKGRAAGRAKIEVICGDKRESVRVTVR